MANGNESIAPSKHHFLSARNKAMRQDLIAKITGRDNDLLPFDLLAETLKFRGQIAHQNVEMIPLDKIVGSVGRYRDFNSRFLPRTDAMAERWARIEGAMNSLAGLPPIDVYRVGDVYFVIDGNHRVSVARANNFEVIPARVVEIPIDIGLEPGDSLDQALLKAGRAYFLAETGLDQHDANPDIYLTAPGGYRLLLEHVKVHLAAGVAESAGATLQDAATRWYRRTYTPIIRAIRDSQLLVNFPNRTAADLYVWVWKTALEMYKISGEQISPEEATELVALQSDPMSFQEEVQGLMMQITGHVPSAQDIPDWVRRDFQWGDAPFAPTWEETSDE